MQAICRSFAALVCVVGGACAGQPVVVEDDAGREVRLSSPATRIVSLAPHATELLFAAGAGDRVVGVSEFSNFPPRAADLPTVGGGAGLDLERIIALQPDLVVGWQSGNARAQLERLDALGLNVFLSEPQNIEAIATSLERLGMLAGTAVQATKAAREFRSGVERLRGEYAERRRVRVFYQIWQRPLMTINGQHMISAWLGLCGADNVFADLPDLASVVDLEAVLNADPDVLMAGRFEGKSERWEEVWWRWPQLRAVSGNHLYTVPAETMERHTPRALSAARELCEHIDKARRE
jgi:iron complex transport system substrate-binding protein